ncbi:aspartyl protease_2 domain-containing protein [Tanacetum coccineum]
MYSSSDDSTYESDYRSGYNSDNFGQSSLHGKRRVLDDLRDVKAEPLEFHEGTKPSKKERDGKAKIKSWRKLKKLLKQRFLPDSYKQDLYIKMTNFKHEQTIARYIGGLNHDIAEKLKLQPYWTFDEVCKLASKIETRIKVKKVEKSAPKLIHKEKCPNQRVMTLREVQEVTLVEEDKEEKPIYDDESCFKERVRPDEGELLVIRRVLHTKEIASNDEQREHIFHSRCTIKGKVCSLIIDSGSCTNVASTTLINKLIIPTSLHPNPYNPQWKNHGTDMKVTKQALFSFSIDKAYQDQVLCDVIPMDACHLLLGKNKLNEGKEHVHPAIRPLLAEFKEVFPTDLPPRLPPLRGIEHQIDLIP